MFEGFWKYIKKSRKKGGIGGALGFGGSGGGKTVPGPLLMEFDDTLIKKRLEIYPVQGNLVFIEEQWQFLQYIIAEKPSYVRDSGEIRLVLEVDCTDPPKPPCPGYDRVEKSGGGTLPAQPQKITLKITRR